MAMTGAKAFFYCCITFCAGIALASLIKIPGMLLTALFGAAFLVIAAGLAAKKYPAAVIGLLILFLLLGFWRFDVAWRAAHDNELVRLSNNNTTGEFLAVIIDDPVFAAFGQQITVLPEGTNGKFWLPPRSIPNINMAIC